MCGVAVKVLCLRTVLTLTDDDTTAHGRQDEPAADVSRDARGLRRGAGARAGAVGLHTRGIIITYYSFYFLRLMRISKGLLTIQRPLS